MLTYYHGKKTTNQRRPIFEAEPPRWQAFPSCHSNRDAFTSYKKYEKIRVCVCVCVCAHVFRHLCSSIRGLGAWGFCSSSASSWDWLFWTKTSDAVPRIDWSQSQFVGHSQSDPVTTSSTDAFLLLISSPAPASNPTGFGCSSAP